MKQRDGSDDLLDALCCGIPIVCPSHMCSQSRRSCAALVAAAISGNSSGAMKSKI